MSVVLAFGREIQRELRQSMGSDQHLALNASLHSLGLLSWFVWRTPAELSLEIVRSVSVVGVVSCPFGGSLLIPSTYPVVCLLCMCTPMCCFDSVLGPGSRIHIIPATVKRRGPCLLFKKKLAERSCGLKPFLVIVCMADRGGSHPH